MSEPLSGAAKVASEMMKDVQAAMKQAETLAQGQQAPQTQFNDVLQNQRVGEVQEVGRTRPEVGDVLRTARGQEVPRVPAIGQTMDSRPLANGLHRMMEEVMSGQNKLEDIINLSLSGRNFSTPEMLAMQAGIYRFTQELELTSKVVEKATSTVKQTMNTQV